MTQFVLSLISTIFIGGVAGYLGSLMIVKRMGLVGDAFAHLAFPGVALALLFNFNVFLGALFSAILGGILIWFLELKTKAPLESLTGLVFALGLTLGFLILPFFDEHQIEEALVGDISKITIFDTILAVILCSLIFFVIKKIYSKLILAEISEDLAKTEGIQIKKYNFIYLVSIAFAVALTVKIVGGLLPVALIVIPPLAAKNLTNTSFSYSFGSLFLGVFSSFLGLFLANLYNLAAGPIIILVGVLIFIFSLFFKKS